MATSSNILKLASSFLRTRIALMHHLTDVYTPSITRNREKLLEVIREKAEQASRSELARKLRVAKGFYTVEMSPPGPGEMQKLKDDLELVKEFIKSGCFKYITVKQAFLLFLVGLEILMWFFIGETIGKMHFVGYQV